MNKNNAPYVRLIKTKLERMLKYINNITNETSNLEDYGVLKDVQSIMATSFKVIEDCKAKTIPTKKLLKKS